MGIATVQGISQRAVPGSVVWQIGIQKIHRYAEAPDATHGVVPGAQMYGAPFDADRGARRHGVHKVIDGPDRWLLVLPAVRIQALVQKYTDSSISKTVNAPNSHTVEQVQELYVKAYDYGCKGVTWQLTYGGTADQA